MSNASAEAVSAPVTSLQTDAHLSHEHSLALLHKLATDDGYRSRFEQKPAAALAELGVPLDMIVNLKSSCLTQRALASKAHFVEAHKELANASADAYVPMNVPSIRLDFGSHG